MKLAVGFLTYNESSAKYLADFLPSLEKALGFLNPVDYQVYAFDNSSPNNHANSLILADWDEASDKPRSGHKLIKYLTTGTNLGFSRAYNILLNLAIQAKAEYFLIINPDTLLDSEVIRNLVSALDKQNNLSSVAPKILRWDFSRGLKTKVIDSLGLIKRPGLQFLDLGQGEEDKVDSPLYSQEIIGPSGAAGLFRLSALVKIADSGSNQVNPHYFDERFFMYKEDCDLAYRLFLAGFKSALVPEAIVYHDRTASSAKSGLRSRVLNRLRKSRQLRIWSFRNQYFIFIKHWSKQNVYNKILIIFYSFSMLIFALILEQFNLKQYYYIWKSFK